MKALAITTKTGGLLAGALAAALLLPASGAAQAEGPGWVPLYGCWDAAERPSVEGAPLLCVRPGGDPLTVQMVNVTAEGEEEAHTLVADGSQRPVSMEGCEGWESARFSADGRRLHMRSEYVCEGDVRQTSSGIISMVTPHEWVDVESVRVAGESTTWVQRYRAADEARLDEMGVPDPAAPRAMAVRASRVSASTVPTVDDVIAASDEAGAEVVEAWVAARNERLDVDADGLVRMADAGVDPAVIDMVVAVSFPEHFAVDEEGAMPRDRTASARAYPSGPYPMAGGWRYGGWRYGYDPFFYSSLYSPFYGGYGYGYYGRYYRPTIIVVGDGDGGGQGGRLVNGRGYTRGDRSSAGSARPSGGSSRPAVRSGSGSSRGPASSGGTTRRAKPRGGGGGGGGGGGNL